MASVASPGGGWPGALGWKELSKEQRDSCSGVSGGVWAALVDVGCQTK